MWLTLVAGFTKYRVPCVLKNIEQCFSNLNMPVHHLGVWLQCRLQPRGPRVGLGGSASHQVPGERKLAALRTALCIHTCGGQGGARR